MREVMRLKHYSIRTKRCYCDWIGRYVNYHGIRGREDLQGAEPMIEQFLSDLAVNGKVAAATQIYTHVMHKPRLGVQSPQDT